MNDQPTNYSALVNRCRKCGHRTALHGQTGCKVEGGVGPTLEPTPCKCKRRFK